MKENLEWKNICPDLSFWQLVYYHQLSLSFLKSEHILTSRKEAQRSSTGKISEWRTVHPFSYKLAILYQHTQDTYWYNTILCVKISSWTALIHDPVVVTCLNICIPFVWWILEEFGCAVWEQESEGTELSLSSLGREEFGVSIANKEERIEKKTGRWGEKPAIGFETRYTM